MTRLRVYLRDDASQALVVNTLRGAGYSVLNHGTDGQPPRRFLHVSTPLSPSAAIDDVKNKCSQVGRIMPEGSSQSSDI